MKHFGKVIYWIVIFAIIAVLIFLIWNIYLGYAGNDHSYILNLFKK